MVVLLSVLRMVRLMFVLHEKRWVDSSLRNLTGDWLRRVEERFAGVNGVRCKVVVAQLFISERSTSVRQVLLRGLSACG
jgi:fatty acid synthase subunit alpha